MRQAKRGREALRITNRFRKLVAELHELPQRPSGESLREFYERYVPQPSRLEDSPEIRGPRKQTGALATATVKAG